MIKNIAKRAPGAHRVQKIVWKLGLWLLLAGLMYIMVYPLIVAVSMSLMSFSDLVNPMTIWLPRNLTLEGYAQAFRALNFWETFRNSMILAVVPPLLQVLSCSVIGYGFARFNFREKNLLFGLMIFTLVVPQHVISLPQFILFRDLNMLNTFWPIILPSSLGLGLKGGLLIFIFRQFFKGMPKELEEAAYIDGSGFLRTFVTVMLPNAIPAAMTVFLFSFVWHYSDVFTISMFTVGDNIQTLVMRVTDIMGILTGFEQTVRDVTQFLPARYAGIIITISPVLLVYLLGQRFLVQGVERSGIVG
ncbi:MAG: carbohydrate ABC transporter permease [Defluviitaleaceae bacterium]|nr:carbohydrate ABC transporter permease [Defluviitaleaceae bacterium]